MFENFHNKSWEKFCCFSENLLDNPSLSPCSVFHLLVGNDFAGFSLSDSILQPSLCIAATRLFLKSFYPATPLSLHDSPQNSKTPLPSFPGSQHLTPPSYFTLVPRDLWASLLTDSVSLPVGLPYS